LSWRLLREGGLMIFDDYDRRKVVRDNVQRPMPAINAFIILNKASLDLIHRDYQVIIRKRAKGA